MPSVAENFERETKYPVNKMAENLVKQLFHSRVLDTSLFITFTRRYAPRSLFTISNLPGAVSAAPSLETFQRGVAAFIAH